MIPFLTELRAVMDWVWTDTTLSLSSWICVEDIYAHIFVLKCWRESEKVRDMKSRQSKQKWWKSTELSVDYWDYCCTGRPFKSHQNTWDTGSRYKDKICLLCVCLCVPALPSASGSKEEEGGKVRDGWYDRYAAHLHRLVPSAVHVPGQISSRRGQYTSGRLCQSHTRRLPGMYTTGRCSLIICNGMKNLIIFHNTSRKCFNYFNILFFLRFPLFSQSSQWVRNRRTW